MTRTTLIASMLILALLTPPLSIAFADDPTTPLLPEGQMAPDFTVNAWKGGDLHLSDYRGKIVVLDFWASWCGPCNESMPHIQKVKDLYAGDNVEVVALCVSDSPEAASKWIRNHPSYSMTFAFDPAGKDGPSEVGDAYQISGIPTTYVIDKQGRIEFDGVDASEGQITTALRHLGARSSEDVAAAAEIDRRARNEVDPGEIALKGKVDAWDPTTDNLTLSASSLRLPSVGEKDFDKPRSKAVLLDSATVVFTTSGKGQLSDLKEGLEIEVTGVDAGVGKTIKARRVVITK